MKFQQVFLSVGLFVYCSLNNMALASNIPTVDEIMGSGVQKGNVWDTLYAICGAIIALIVLCVIGWIFIEIAHGAATIYSEIKAERKTYSAMAGHIVAGVALLGLAIVVMTYTAKLFG